MPRLTPAELAERRRQRAEEREQEAREEAEAEAARMARAEWLKEAEARHSQLSSVAEGLYDELDKMARKWPQMPVTERTITRVNTLLGAVRNLLADEGDEFVQGLDDIVGAGDPPETRDVVVLLREVKDALQRFRAKYGRTWIGF